MVCLYSLWPSYFMYNLHPQLLDLYLSLYSIIYDPVILKPFISSLVTAPSIKQPLPHAAAYYHVLYPNVCTSTCTNDHHLILRFRASNYHIPLDYCQSFAYLYQLYIIIICVEHGYFVRSEVLTAMTRKIITVIWNPMICSLLERYIHFGGMCCLYLQGTFLT